jgi:hypothetical protein
MRMAESSSAINIRMATLLSQKRKEPLRSASSTGATFASPQQYNVRSGMVTSMIPCRLRIGFWDHDREKRRYYHAWMDEGRKRVLGIIAGILVVRHS